MEVLAQFLVSSRLSPISGELALPALLLFLLIAQNYQAEQVNFISNDTPHGPRKRPL
jgi:hypothetical protein